MNTTTAVPTLSTTNPYFAYLSVWGGASYRGDARVDAAWHYAEQWEQDEAADQAQLAAVAAEAARMAARSAAFEAYAAEMGL
jgi:uncharacterized protein (DUF2235 family)